MASRKKQEVGLAIFDLDNTLFDWVDVWHSSFSALLRVVQERSGVALDVLKKEFRTVHQRHGTTEYAFAIEELPSLQALHPGEPLAELYGPAVAAFRDARQARLSLYPRVRETLLHIKAAGTTLVAYTESMDLYAGARVRDLDLDRCLDVLYSPRHDGPTAAPATLRHCEHRLTPPGELKPNPKVLLDIINDAGVPRARAIYVGDSRLRDVSMAKVAGVTSVWARYGTSEEERPEYALLREVLHWTDNDVARERSLADVHGPDVLTPDFVLRDGLDELLDLFEFVRPR